MNIDILAGFVLLAVVGLIGVLYLYWNWKLNRVHKVPEWVYDTLLIRLSKRLSSCLDVLSEADFIVEEIVEWNDCSICVDIRVNREFIENGMYQGNMEYREEKHFREAFVSHEFFYQGAEANCDFDDKKLELFIENY